MTRDRLMEYIRALTKRIGKAKRRNVPEEVERLRCLRVALIEALAERHDVWTPVNPKGRTEFLAQAVWKARMSSWLQNRDGL